MRLIDADALRDNLQALAYDDWNQGVTTSWADAYSEVADMVEEMPTIEERKTGKWTPKENRPKQEVFICSECGGWAYSPWIGSRKTPKPNKCKYSYCPNCGSYNGGET